MSDRYKQLEIVEHLEQVDAPKLGKKSKPKIESEMYPNFAFGDRVTGSNYESANLIGNVSYVSNFGFAVIWDGRTRETHYDRKDANSIIKKVRVHFPSSEDSKTAAQEPDSQEEDHKSPSIHYEIKEIKGGLYKYARWWEGDRHKSKYIGRA